MFDEMMFEDGSIRPHYLSFDRWKMDQVVGYLESKKLEADHLFRQVGITFSVYGDDVGTERLIPFDLVPRIIPASQWHRLEKGLAQRVQALNLFLKDVYGSGDILRAGIIPANRVLGNAQFRKEMLGLNIPSGIYSMIAGIDLVCVGEDEWYVLEDNLRVPSGVSYMLENRKMMMRLFPDLFGAHSIAPVAHYPDLLLETLRQGAPDGLEDPTVVVLTPGLYNSAYFEHAFLAQQMGVELVEGSDLLVEDDTVYMQTTHGKKRVDVIYRRIDDDYLDPEIFKADSMLGVKGLMRAYRAGRVTLANAVGTGVADDKSIYPYVPEMIRFYLGQEPILHNVPTYICSEPDSLNYVLDNLDDLVVKEVHGAGGYGMLIGPSSSKAQISEFRSKLRANPEAYIAQPTLSLSTCPTMVEQGIAPRHIDLRPFVLSSPSGVRMVPGGLTRVALQEGSLVVNSSQGGGTKDTWVAAD